jgi:16S rRNA (cytidine1402-2'-O)-methyltransferase
LTKVYEEIRRGGLGALAAGAVADPPRGEITLVVAGAPAVPAERPTDADLRAAVAGLEATGTPRKAAIVAVATGRGLPRREVYNAVHAPLPADDQHSDQQ